MKPTDRQSTTGRFNLRRPDLNREFRLHRMLYACCITLVGVDALWAVYNIASAQWGQLAIRFILITAGAVAFVLVRKGQIKHASIVLATLSFLVFFILCAVYDVPTLYTPRTVHIFFLLIGIACFMGFKEEDSYVLCYGFPLICFIAYGFFASSQWGVVTPYAMSASERAICTWLNNIIALSLIYVLFYVTHSRAKESNAMEIELRKALSNNQFALYYQPQSSADDQVIGAEALIRWHHPSKGIISPDDFIPLAEQIGLIRPLGHWVVGTACAQLVKWSKKPETAHLSLSINVSAQEFKQEDYVSQVLSILERSGARPSLLKLELTESMLVNDVDDIIAKMTSLKAAGVRISLDDFGTGYSSLSYLKRLPLDQLKVDQSFVREMLSSIQDEAIVRTVVSLAQNMDLDVIAEGVETEEQRQFLQSIGCFSIQGYLLSRPLRIHDFNVFIRHRLTAPTVHVDLELQNA
jgi:EAL domain-containing protein (putative c-di-GMP-specific phosphodiesterase class I)